MSECNQWATLGSFESCDRKTGEEKKLIFLFLLAFLGFNDFFPLDPGIVLETYFNFFHPIFKDYQNYLFLRITIPTPKLASQ